MRSISANRLVEVCVRSTSSVLLLIYLLRLPCTSTLLHSLVGQQIYITITYTLPVNEPNTNGDDSNGEEGR